MILSCVIVTRGVPGILVPRTLLVPSEPIALLAPRIFDKPKPSISCRSCETGSSADAPVCCAETDAFDCAPFEGPARDGVEAPEPGFEEYADPTDDLACFRAAVSVNDRNGGGKPSCHRN